MSILPKIKIGRKSDRNFFDFSHDVNTTSDFGFCQPTILQNIVADSKINLKTSSFVRLAPLPVPTFGRINVKQHTAFVPYRDVFLAYDSFLAHKTVTSGVRSYIPEQADTMTNNRLFNFILNCSFNASRDTVNTIKNGLFFKVAVFGKENRVAGLAGPALPVDRYSDLINDDSVFGDDFNKFVYANRIRLLARCMDDDFSGGTCIFNQLLLQNFGHRLNYLDGMFRTKNLDSPDWPFMANLRVWRENKSLIETVPDYEKNMFGSTIQERYLEGLSTYDEPFFSEDITIQNADFIFRYTFDPENPLNIELHNSLNGDLSTVQIAPDFVFCIKLTALGRRLFKILNCNRVNFGYKDKPVDILSLYSYYKVWFDQYNPGRNLVWQATNCYKLIHSFYDFGYDLNNIYDYDSISVDQFTFATSPQRRALAHFLSDLASCTYCLPIDNITVATQDLLTNTTDTQIEDVGVLPEGSSVDEGLPQRYGVTGSDSQPYGHMMDVEQAGGLGVKLLERIYHLVNKNSVLGSRIDEYLKAHNLGSPLPESLVLNDNDYSIMVDEQFSTAETAEGYLGEYAGKAKEYNAGEFMSFETANAGVLVQYFCIVPFGGYVQGAKLGMVNRYDFYNSFYDSLGKEALTKYQVLSRFYLLNNIADDSVYGFVPQYFSKKVTNNLANGGFAFRSQMAQFLPYSLDRIFSVPDVVVKSTKYNNGDENYLMEEIEETENLDIQADEYLRFIGRNEGFGNYNRIFYDTTGLTDNFIVQIVQDFKIFAPMKPVSESFDTFDKDVDNGVTNISHS